MGIVRDWTTHCFALSNMGTTYNEQLQSGARNNTGNKKGSIKITRRKIDILTTSRCRSFGRQGGKSGPRYKTRSQTQGAKDLSLIWDGDFGQNMRHLVWEFMKEDQNLELTSNPTVPSQISSDVGQYCLKYSKILF